MRHPADNRVGLTLIEILVVITIIAVLAALGIAVAGVVTKRVHAATTRSRVVAISNAMDVYRGEDKLGRFPPAVAGRAIECDLSGAASSLTGNLLADVGLSLTGDILINLPSGRKAIADAWGEQVMYQADSNHDGVIDPPTDASGVAVALPGDAPDWNPDLVEPFAYVWSWNAPSTQGAPHAHGDARSWIYRQQAAK